MVGPGYELDLPYPSCHLRPTGSSAPSEHSELPGSGHVVPATSAAAPPDPATATDTSPLLPRPPPAQRPHRRLPGPPHRAVPLPVGPRAAAVLARPRRLPRLDLAWLLLMRQLVPSDPATGAFTRTPSHFPAVTDDVAPGARLHLYVGLPCLWPYRAFLVRALLGLERRLPVSVAVRGGDGSWSLTPDSPDALYGKLRLRDVYAARSGGFDGRASVPMLWDADRREVVCNESTEIAKFLCTLAVADDGSRGGGLDLWPPELRQEIDRCSDNNGVHRCGFAQSQEAYEAEASELFGALDMLEDNLSGSRYLCAGGGLPLADVCLFTTQIRFDLVYNPLFRCTRRKLVEYPSLHAYTREIYQMPGVADTCDMGAIAEGYFGTLFPLNPGGIKPVVPASCGREALL